jgi:hypothetical protein
MNPTTIGSTAKKWVYPDFYLGNVVPGFPCIVSIYATQTYIVGTLTRTGEGYPMCSGHFLPADGISGIIYMQ